MITFTKHSLQKLEGIFEELGYVIRYEKGNFNSGYCIVEERKIAVINRFFETEARMNALLDILESIEFEPAILSEKASAFYEKVIKHKEAAKEEKGD